MNREKLEAHKELRRLRQRPHGVNVVSLALGKKAAPEEEALGVVTISLIYFLVFFCLFSGQ